MGDVTCDTEVHRRGATRGLPHTWIRKPHMGWLRLVGSIKVQVSFAKYSLFYRALLQKRLIILWILVTKASAYASHDSFMSMRWSGMHMNESCPASTFIHMCDMTHSYVWHDSFICVTWLIHMCGMTHSYVWQDSFICVTWLIRMCDVTHVYVWHDSFICVTWLIHVCDMTHSYVRRGSFVCVMWLIHMCDMTHSYVWHGSFIGKCRHRAKWLTKQYEQSSEI